MKSIVFLGDSILARKHQDGVIALAPRVKNAFPAVTVISYAAGGATSQQCLARLGDVTVPSNSLVIISLGMNDAAPWKQISLEEFLKNYELLLAKLTSCTLVLVAPYPVDVDKQIPPGRDNETLRSYAQEVSVLAQQHKVAVIDLFRVIGGAAAEGEDLHVSDGVHLNDRGYSLFFDQLKPHIKHWLETKAKTSTDK